jgi:hypothetical protein
MKYTQKFAESSQNHHQIKRLKKIDDLIKMYTIIQEENALKTAYSNFIASFDIME